MLILKLLLTCLFEYLYKLNIFEGEKNVNINIIQIELIPYMLFLNNVFK